MLQLAELEPIGENAMISLNYSQLRLTLIAMLFVATFAHSQVLVQSTAPTPALAKLLSDTGPCAYAPIDRSESVV